MTAKNRRHYAFGQGRLCAVVAHGGVGEIRTRRVEDHRTPGGAHFVDLTIVPPGCTIGVHTHGPADEEVYIVVAGRGRMRLGNESFEVGPGDVVINDRGGTHGLVNDGPEEVRLVVIETPARPLTEGEAP